MLRLPYRKLQIWLKAINIVKHTYQVTKKLPKEELYGLVMQMRRAAVSVASNIAEGSQRGSNKDFANFILMAKGSLAELDTQQYIARTEYAAVTSEYEALEKEIDELQKMLFVFHKKLITISDH